ncbi:MAG: signal peptidase I [Acutalibacteraceae bacterium]|nr:signal peptidase I [Acutalibacteraceae bacterium]
MKNENKSLVFYILYSLFRSISILILLLTFVLRFAVVDGPSMQNTLHDKDVALITNYYPYFDEISDNEYIPFDFSLKQGDIVAIAPSNESDNEYNIDNAFIKRIIAVEGQTIGFDTENSAVYVDGKIIDEPYLSSSTLSGVEWEIPDVIPEDKVFVMGDNRTVSVDSRSIRIQLVDKKDIIGKVQCVLYPFDRISYAY